MTYAVVERRLRIGTVRAVVRQLDLSWDDFLKR